MNLIYLNECGELNRRVTHELKCAQPYTEFAHWFSQLCTQKKEPMEFRDQNHFYVDITL